MRNLVLIITTDLSLSACVSPETKQRHAAEQLQEDARLEAKIPELAGVFEKACIPYLNGESAEAMISVMEGDQFGSRFNLRNRGSFLVVTNPVSEIQLQMEINSDYYKRCNVFAIPHTRDILSKQRSIIAGRSVRDKAAEDLRIVAENFAQEQGKRLKSSQRNKFHIGIGFAPDYLFEVPLEGSSLGMTVFYTFPR